MVVRGEVAFISAMTIVVTKLVSVKRNVQLTHRGRLVEHCGRGICDLVEVIAWPPSIRRGEMLGRRRGLLKRTSFQKMCDVIAAHLELVVDGKFNRVLQSKVHPD